MTADRSLLEGQLGFSAVVILSAINIFFSVFGTVGNALVCMAVWKNTVLQAGVNFCIVSLAAADLLVCVFTQPVYVLSLSGYSEAHFQMVYYVVTSTSLYASLNSLLLMTMNRMIAIYYPLRFKSILSRRNITISIAGAWILSFIEGILRTFTAFKVITSHIRILAVIVFVAMYTKIFMVARHHCNRMKTQARSLAFNHELAMIQSESRTSKTAALIVCTFVLSFLPITILLLVDTSNKLSVEICFTIMCCSSSVNPLVYAWRSDRFRAAVLELFTCCPHNRVVPNLVTATMVPVTIETEINKQHNYAAEELSPWENGRTKQVGNHKQTYGCDNEALDMEEHASQTH